MDVARLCTTLKVAVTDASAVSVTVHAPVPLQAPDQPANVDVAFGAADSVTAVPLAKLALQVDPQLMPAGLLVMVPAPPPALWTANLKFTAGGVVFVVLDAQPDKTNENHPRHKKKKTALQLGIGSGDRRTFWSK